MMNELISSENTKDAIARKTEYLSLESLDVQMSSHRFSLIYF